MRKLIVAIFVSALALAAQPAFAQSSRSIGPDHPAAKALVAFLDAMLARNGPATLARVTDDLRARAPNGFTGLSNPCLYRYAVLALTESSAPGRPPETVEATARIYTHDWPGDVAGGPPRSFVQGLTLVDTPSGWRVSDLSPAGPWREEPGEPHGPHLSACDVGRQPPVWLMASTLPATGDPPPILLLALGLALGGMGLAIRARRRIPSRQLVRGDTC